MLCSSKHNDNESSKIINVTIALLVLKVQQKWIANAIRLGSCNVHVKIFSSWKKIKQNKPFCSNRRINASNLWPIWSSHFVSLLTSVCNGQPRPSESTVDWTLLFGDAGLRSSEERSQFLSGRLHLVEEVQQPSLGLCLHIILWQEVHHLLDAVWSSAQSPCCLRNSGPRRDLSCSMLLLIHSPPEAFSAAETKTKLLINLF